jgi:hypothetical protein
MSDVGAPGDGPEQELSPEQEQMLRQMEEEMRRIRVQDLIAQSVVSILNLAYRRIAKEDERDLEQARAGIDAVRALVDSLEEEPQREIRNALSQVQMIYAQHAGESAPQEDAPAAAGGGPEPPSGPGAAESGSTQKPPPGLWIPGSG